MVSKAWKGLFVVVVLAICLSGAGVTAAVPESESKADSAKETKKSPTSILQATGGAKSGQPVRTFTNADLEKMFGGGAEDTAAADRPQATPPASDGPSVRQVGDEGRTALERLQDRERAVFVAQADAPPCSDCGEIMVRNGACYACVNCGATSGCS